MDKRLAFIGGGNIAQAILSGLVPTFEDPRTIIVADPSEEHGPAVVELAQHIYRM